LRSSFPLTSIWPRRDAKGLRGSGATAKVGLGKKAAAWLIYLPTIGLG
jgi:hypothetical protein